MHGNTLANLVEDTLEAEDVSIPIFNKVALELQQLIRKGDFSLEDISKIIQKDPGLVSDVLKIANSSFYAGMNPAKTVNEATVRLGARTIFNLVTAVTQKQLYRSRKKNLNRWMKPMWTHSLGVAFASRWVCRELRMNQVTEEAFMSGLLHDIGKLFILRVIQDVDGPEFAEGGISTELVEEALDTMHARQGERLMRKMNMPELYCQVVGMHHDKDLTGERDVVTVVRLVNLACHHVGIGLKHEPDVNLSGTAEVQVLAVEESFLSELLSKLKEYVAVLDQL